MKTSTRISEGGLEVRNDGNMEPLPRKVAGSEQNQTKREARWAAPGKATGQSCSSCLVLTSHHGSPWVLEVKLDLIFDF